MSQRGWSWVIGGGVALLALFAVATTVPVRTAPVESQPIDLHATSSAADAPACATMRLTGTLESQRRTPLVNLWGVSDVAVVVVSPKVHIGGDAACPENVDVAQSQVIVFTPDCDDLGSVDSEDPFETMSEPHSRCGGAGLALPGLVGEGGFDATTSANTGQRFALARSGVIAANTWCLGSEFGVGYDVHGESSVTATGVAADQVEGDLCIDLS